MDHTSWNRFTIAVANVISRTTWAALSTVFPSTFVAVVPTNVPVIVVPQNCPKKKQPRQVHVLAKKAFQET